MACLPWGFCRCDALRWDPAWWPGGDRLSRRWCGSTMGAGGFHGRVRDGIGCGLPAMATGPPGRVLGASRSGMAGWLAGPCVGAARCCARCRGIPLAGGPSGARRGGWEFIRAIRTARLSGSPHVYLRPIDVVVFHGPRGRPGLEGGFPLRCLQRLSRPHLATRRCGWRHNRCTRGASVPVLSYWGRILSGLLRPRQIGTELSHDVLNPAHVPL